MRLVLFVLILVAGGVATADDDPPAQPRPEETPPAPPPAPAPPAQGLPPIHINITNNNNGNNSNTSTQTNQQDNKQGNQQDSRQDNKQDNHQTNTQTVPSPPVVQVPEIPAPATVAPRGLVARHASRRDRARWVALGALGGHDGAGVRLAMDLLARRAWALGVAASASGDGHDLDDASGGAVAYLAWTRKLGRFEVRAQLGIGIGKRDRDGRRHGGDGRGRDGDDVIARSTTDPVEDEGDDGDGHHHRGGGLARRAEAALLVRLPIGRRLGLLGGPIVTGTTDRGRRHGRLDKSMFLGLSYRF